MFNLENSINEWLRLFNKHRAFDPGSLQEMEHHIRDHIDDLVSDGYSEQDAFNLAVQEFGEIPKVAKEEFWNQQRNAGVRRFVFAMLLNNYFKTSTRALLRNPLTSFINIFGLSVAIGICVLGYAFHTYVNRIDQFHGLKDRVYLTTFFADRDGELVQNGKTPGPLGPMMSNDISKIEKISRIKDLNAVLKRNDQVFQEQVRLVDPSFLEMLSYPVKWGQASSLSDPNSIVLSEDISIKYFGEVDPVGEYIQIIFGPEQKKLFKVSAVLKDFPAANSIRFNLLINFENLKWADTGYQSNDWGYLLDGTLIQIPHLADITDVTPQMDKYMALQNAIQSDWQISDFTFVSIAQLYKKSAGIRGDISNDGYGVMVFSKISFVIICMFLVALASANYINIAIVSATKRLKEIGLRKVIGANKRMVIFQFLSENIFLMILALLTGLLLGTTVFIPWLENSSSFNMGFTLTDPYLWIFLPGVLLFTGIISGLYPAFYVSRFQVASIFKGTTRFGRKNLLTKVFLGFQLVLACALISVAVMFAQNTLYQADRSWGYDQFNVLYSAIPDADGYEPLRNELLRNPNIESLSGSNHHLGRSTGTKLLKKPNKEFEVDQLAVDHNYFSTLGIELKQGRFFRKDHESDNQAIIVNETLVKHLELQNPIGELFKIDSARYEVIGVVQDFHTYNFWTKIAPTFFQVAEEETYGFLSMKVKEGSSAEVRSLLRQQWAELFPEVPFDGGYQVDTWGNYYEELQSNSRFWKALATIVTLMASLGLYGLVSLNVAGRGKEFSIRKILGAQLQNIASSITRQYVFVFASAILIGAPVGYFITQTIFDSVYHYHMPLGYSFLAISGGFMGAVLVAVVGLQVRKLARSNPVDGLRVE